MNGGKLAALAAGLIPSIKAACVRFWLALSFVRFLECAEQNRQSQPAASTRHTNQRKAL